MRRSVGLLLVSALGAGSCWAAAERSSPADLTESLSQHLWRSRIEAPSGPSGQPIQEEIRRLIAQVSAVQPKARSGSGSASLVEVPGAGPAPVQVPEPNRAAPVHADPCERSALVSSGPVDALREVLDRLDPSVEVADPLQLAELLYCSERPQAALVYYRQALKRLDARRGANQRVDQDRAWVLLQIGNCLRGDDPVQARAVFQQVAAEYPTGPWKSLAESWRGLADWYVQADVNRLLAQVRTPQEARQP